MCSLQIFTFISIFLLVVIAEDLPKKDTPPNIVIHATNRTSIPSVHYIVDAVECLKEAYAIYAEDNDKAKLYSELFQEKHPETEWNVVVGYTAAHIKSQWFVETSVSDGKNKNAKKDKDKDKTTLFLIFSTS